jgi:L-2-hydroxyglutarate oxidase LhgO
MNIYPTPISVTTPSGRHFTVGVHLTPTFEDLSYPPALSTTVTVGPKLVPARDREDWSGPSVDAKAFAGAVVPFFPALRAEDLLWHQSGLQARLKTFPDFIIKAGSRLPNVINLLGIDSPGLTSCLAIADRTVEKVGDIL